MYKSMLLLLYLLLIKLTAIKAKVDLCGNDEHIDLTNLNHATIWDLKHIQNDPTIDLKLSLCKPLDANSGYKECEDKYICQTNTFKNNTHKAIGFEPKYISSIGKSISVQFEGPICEADPNRNYSLNIRFTCGTHLEYPQYFLGSKCRTNLIWRTLAACREKTIQNEIKCYVYDNNGKRRDLTPLIRPKGGHYKVLSPNEEFYINVCSDVTDICPGNGSGACLKDGANKLQTVGDYRWSELSYKSQSTSTPEHIELTYESRSNLCSYGSNNNTSKTTIRFLCPSKHQKRSTDFVERNPRLVSNLDCDYQIEWFTQFACPLDEIEVEANKCQLTENKHGFDFNLKSLLKRNSQYYKVENISLDSSNEQLFDIYFNVCGGLGDFSCGDKQWATNSVCLKSKDGKSDKVIGSINDGKLRFADNKLILKYSAKDTNCKFGENLISESTIIEFVCDDNKNPNFIGKPEFVSFEDCTYYLLWKTSLVCPIVNTATCITTYKDMTFDLSLLRKGFGSEPWIAGVKQSLPWSRHAKAPKDTIYLNVCDLLPQTPNTTSCDADSSACMTIGGTNSSVNLGKYTSLQFNEDINTLELIYENGFDSRSDKKIRSKITLRCNPGNLDLSPVLIDIDEELNTYEFEWETAAACPIDVVEGDNCQVYDKFLDYTFDLNELKANSYYSIKYEKYEFQINVCDSVKNSTCNSNVVKNADGPFGACQVETEGDHRVFSLGKANYSLIYWNGIINLTYTEGTPYRNPEKTPRKSHIAFICDPNIAKGHPEFDGEKDRAYFFRWYTSLACPHTPKIVHCVWDNGSHILDLTELANTQGNHFAVGHQHIPAIYYINICRPLNPLHKNDISLKGCGRNSAACKIMILNNTVLNLGEASDPPISGFDGSINLFYRNGSPCPSNPSKNISTRIKFICDLNGDLGSPTVIEPGNEEMDGEECIYLFEWRTSAVCNAIQPTKLQLNSCVFTDWRTNLTVDLSSLKKPTNSKPYEVSLDRSKSVFELNVCGTANSFASNSCKNSAVCFRSPNQTIYNYGSLNSSSFFFDGMDLKLRYFNGSKCSNSDTGKKSTEIVFKCNPESKQSSPKLYSVHPCIAVFHWETDLVCGLQLPKCSILYENNFYNLRQLSTISHAWNTTDKDGNIYFLNVCTKLPESIGCKGNAASCKCKYDSNGKLDCNDNLGDPSSHQLNVTSNGNLLLTYNNGNENHCGKGMPAKTQIIFICGERTGNPKFLEFIKSECVYKFKWITFMACPVANRNDVLVPQKDGFLEDQRIKALINIKPLLNKTFRVNEMRPENYTYVINLSEHQFNDDICANAAVCQTKPNSDFKRDIGSYGSMKYYLKGHELQIVLTSFNKQKCGKNKNKNVTTIIKLQCSSSSGVGEPYFVYESNDCDYIFNWETDAVCAPKFVDISDGDNSGENTPNDKNSSQNDNQTGNNSHSSTWIGVFIILCVVVTLTILVFYKQRARQSLMFRFRRLFTPESDHTFHYHQLASYEKDKENEVAFINCSQSNNPNTIAAQPSRYVPYYSIYDDSDVDLLT